jgi:glucose/arabinose dehydrogenase
MQRTALLLACAFTLVGQGNKTTTDVKVVGHVYKPAAVEATQGRILSLKVPEGFQVEKFAENLGNARMIAVADDGAVYVTRRREGDCLMLRDTDGDGRSDQQRVVAKRPDMHGIYIHDGHVYLATVKEVFVAARNADGSLGELKQIIGDLPDGGQHPNRTLAVGPDGKLYITVGSTCNECAETNDEHATVLRVNLDGSGREIFAKGLRNTIAIAWHPVTKQMYGMDHGIDWLGDNEHVEEFNLLEQGADYGWPYIYGEGKVNPAEEPPPGKTMDELLRTTRKPILGYTPHAAPMQMVFYTSDEFPAEYRNNAFVTMRGSWNRKPASGYEVVRLRFEGDKPVAFEPFLTGFLQQDAAAHFGRPVGLAIAKDGSLLVGDDTNGVIYRVVYAANEQIRSRKISNEKE